MEYKPSKQFVTDSLKKTENMDEDMKKFMEKGANGVLGKPVKNEYLQEVLIRYL